MLVNWDTIDTVLLDMDGTLLDLHFDNYFWQEHLPACWAEQRGLDREAGQALLAPRFRSLEGTLSWYCLDFWDRELELDVLALKDDVQHLIGLRPHVEELLTNLVRMGKACLLVTNAHQRVLEYKLARTSLAPHFQHMITAHDYGQPKEAMEFWQHLHRQFDFVPERTLLIDDNHKVLEAARCFGILHLLTIARPDSRQPPRLASTYQAIEDFRELFSVSAAAGDSESEITR